jgi:hypothetical protein
MRRHYRVAHQTPGLDHSTPGDSEEHGCLQWEKVEVAESSPEVEAVLEWREPRKFINYFVSENEVPSGSDLTPDGLGSIADAADESDNSTCEEGDALAVHLLYPYASTEARSQAIYHPVPALRSGFPAAVRDAESRWTEFGDINRQDVCVDFIFTYKFRVFVYSSVTYVHVLIHSFVVRIPR